MRGDGVTAGEPLRSHVAPPHPAPLPKERGTPQYFTHLPKIPAKAGIHCAPPTPKHPASTGPLWTPARMVSEVEPRRGLRGVGCCPEGGVTALLQAPNSTRPLSDDTCEGRYPGAPPAPEHPVSNLPPWTPACAGVFGMLVLVWKRRVTALLQALKAGRLAAVPAAALTA